VLPLRARLPSNRHDARDHRGHDRGIGFPILGLRIPAAAGRPDVFWVGDFAAAAHCYFGGGGWV